MLIALREPVEEIVQTVHNVLELTPPELASDISSKGILLTGGGSLIQGIDKLLEERMGIAVNIAMDPIECVAIGTGKSLEWVQVLQENTRN